MRISLVTYGSRGDVQPIIALAVSLKKAGHDPLVAGPPENAAWVRDHGLRFLRFGSPFTAYADQFKNAHGLSAAIHFSKFLLGEVKLQFEQAPAIMANADLVIGASLAFAVHSVAEYRDIPYRFIAFCPQIIPSARHPYPAVAFQRMPGWLNRLSWRLTEWADGALIRRPVNRCRCQLGLPPIRSVWNNLLGPDVLVASDPVLADLPSDIKVPATQSGYLHLDQQGVRDPILQQYIKAGSPPVFIGFGSMPRKDSEGLLEMFRNAARRANCRTIIYRRGRSIARVVSEDCCIVGDVDHSRVMPYCGAVVHHGGAGTTAAAARAGVPQIIVPHMLDQFYWAQQIGRLGLGPRGISRLRLNAKSLGRAIITCMTDGAMQRCCRRTADWIKSHQSLDNAVAWVETAPAAPFPKNQCIRSKDMLTSTSGTQ
jgi:UDP:flavonoid glycosyltransferase YjiC (YdhE family)